MADTPTAVEDGAKVPEKINEDDLMKSLRELEATPEVKEEVKEPVVEATKLEKKVADTIEENGSETLKKSLDVSDSLSEFASLIGDHMDTSLQVLQKSIQQSAERDASFIKIMTTQSAQIEALTKSLAEFGEKPTGTTKTKTSVEKTEVLEKSVSGDGGSKEPRITKPQIMTGLLELQKNATDPNQKQEYTNALVTYESANHIEDHMLQKSIGSYRKLSLAAA